MTWFVRREIKLEIVPIAQVVRVYPLNGLLR